MASSTARSSLSPAFVPRNRGHLVNVASVAGKAGAAGGVTYCATKHAVVGLSEAIRAEVRNEQIDVSIVMPVGVNTELYSGVQPIKGFKVAEPEDVAAAIVEALRPVGSTSSCPSRSRACSAS